MVKAAQTHHSYKGKPLYWTSPDAQCCNFCGKPDHLAKSFKGKNQSCPGNNNGNNRTPNPNLQNGTASGGSMHDNQLVDTQLHKVHQMMTELQSMFKGLQAEVTALNKKVDDRIKNKSVSHSPISQKPISSVSTPVTLQTIKQIAPAPHNPISVENSTSSAKRTYTDVESSSSGSDNDNIIKQQSEINSSMSLMSSKLDQFINYMGFGSSPDLIDGGDDDECVIMNVNNNNNNSTPPPNVSTFSINTLSLKVVTTNLKSLTSDKQQYLLDMLENQNIHICGVSETWRKALNGSG
ncbi:unnamed protein product [Rhizophagus irregularis]|nr:unnamed protein product [Rhizophagus irregularis]